MAVVVFGSKSVEYGAVPEDVQDGLVLVGCVFVSVLLVRLEVVSDISENDDINV